MNKKVRDYQSSIVQVLNFYGFTNMPFGKEIHSSDIFQTASLMDSLSMLEIGIETEDILLLSGLIGCGKSIAIRRFISSLDFNLYVPVYIQGYIKSAQELCKMVLKGLYIDPPFSPLKAKSLYQKSIMEMNKKPVIIIDDAQDMADSPLLSIKSLVNFEQDSKSRVTILLAGQPELKDRLTFAAFSAVRQRIKLDIALNPMTLEETCGYIAHSLKIAGRSAPLFSDNAKSEIFKMASGIPRVINRVCFKALIQGTIKKVDVIDSNDVPFDNF